MVVDMSLSETIAGAVMYMYFVSFSAGMGLLTAAWIGLKYYRRNLATNNKKQQRNKGVV